MGSTSGHSNPSPDGRRLAGDRAGARRCRCHQPDAQSRRGSAPQGLKSSTLGRVRVEIDAPLSRTAGWRGTPPGACARSSISVASAAVARAMNGAVRTAVEQLDSGFDLPFQYARVPQRSAAWTSSRSRSTRSALLPALAGGTGRRSRPTLGGPGGQVQVNGHRYQPETVHHPPAARSLARRGAAERQTPTAARKGSVTGRDGGTGGGRNRRWRNTGYLT